MSTELQHQSGLDEVAITLHDSELELSKPSKPESEMKKFTSSYWFTALVGIGTFTITTFALNVPTISEAVRVANSENELDKSVNEIALKLSDSTVYVNCDDNPLNKLDISDPLYEDGVTYTRAGIVRSVRIPFGLTFYPPVTTLKEDVCSSIANFSPPLGEDSTDPFFIQRDSNDTLNYANNLSVLLHEIEHTKEISNEAEADCYAIQKLPAALVASGIDPMNADLLSYEVANGRTEYSMSEYISEECKPGGDYDLGIGGPYITPPSNVAILPLVTNPVQPN